LQVELQQSQKYYKSKKTNLFDAIINQEKTENTRILIESEFFITLIPAFTDFPFGVFIIAKHNNIITFEDFNEVMIADLALHIHKTTSAFERLYNRPFPYMMCVHQAPINDHFKSAYQTYFRFHIEFYPPLRDANRLKYYASSELGAWAAANPCDINQCATMLKNQIQ
jgi:UDPglucose--hexose-1-phosphate uridylyltransferase